MVGVIRLINKPIDSNCFIIINQSNGYDCIIVDPGSYDVTNIVNTITNKGLQPQYIILTHEHFDHCWGVDLLREKYPELKLACSSICSAAIQNKKRNQSVFYQQPGFELKKADSIIEEIGWKLKWQSTEIRFMPAQGHTAAGVMFTVDRYLFTGDELIKGIRTVTKLKTGSKEKLYDSVALLESLKGRNLTVCPGHGDLFELDNYVLNNAFVNKIEL